MYVGQNCNFSMRLLNEEAIFFLVGNCECQICTGDIEKFDASKMYDGIKQCVIARKLNFALKPEPMKANRIIYDLRI